MFQNRLKLVTVSTHSRLKAAGGHALQFVVRNAVSTHSRLKAAGILDVLLKMEQAVSTHSRLKAAGLFCFIGTA